MTTFTFAPHNCEIGTCKVDWMAGDKAIEFMDTLREEILKAFPHANGSVLWRTEQGFIVGIGFRNGAPRFRGNQFDICAALKSDEERIALFDALVEHMKATLEA